MLTPPTIIFNDLWNDLGLANGNKLRSYRKFKVNPCTEPYVKLIRSRQHRSNLAKLRCGTLPLQIELGRFSRPPIPLEERTCNYCNQNIVEDEFHFLMNCRLYSDIRCNLLMDAHATNNNF